MNPILIECKGISTDLFSLPPFILHKGKTIGIYTGNNEPHSAEQYLTAIFTGKVEHKNTIVYKNFTFVDYIWESEWRRIFYPITVGEYLKKNADPNSHYSKKIYEYEWINKKTKLNSLPGNPRKLLSLYSVISKKTNIIIDFVGQDTQGIILASKVIQEEIKKGSSAVLFDSFRDLKNSCDHYLEIEWKDNRNDIESFHYFPKN